MIEAHTWRMRTHGADIISSAECFKTGGMQGVDVLWISLG